MMVIDLRVVPQGHSTVTGTTDLETVQADLPPIDSKVTCKAEIDRTGSDVYVHLWYRGVFLLQCSRCLGSFKTELSGDFRIILKEVPGKFGAAVDDDSADFYFDTQHDQVDVSTAIYDEIMTALPLKPLCSSECGGVEVADEAIHVDYGKSAHEKKKMDPRWEALLKLKEKNGN